MASAIQHTLAVAGAVATAAVLSMNHAPAQTPAAAPQVQQLTSLLSKYCVGCHGGNAPAAGIRLDFRTEEEARTVGATRIDFWDRVSSALATNRMPPSRVTARPTDAERSAMVEKIAGTLLTSNGMPDPGPFMLRRLNNRQYANTVRQLLFLPDDYNAAADFPPDERGDGFDNNSATLTISPLLIESYLKAAEEGVITALSLDPKRAAQGDDATLASRSKLNAPSQGMYVDFANRQEKILVNMRTFLPLAFRRPVAEEEIQGFMKFAALSFAHAGESFDEATALTIRAALMSPEFLFMVERDPNPDGSGKVFEITEFQLASRLSYFLWATMPDEDLFIAARDKRLRSNLDAVVARMLKDPKAISLTKDFLGQWLEIRGMQEVTNAPKSLLESMRGETEHVFDYIVRNDRSILEFLDSDYTFVNEELAKLYGIEGVTGPEFRKVQVDSSRRGGIFTQASFLTLTAKPLGNSRRTSPVLRGKWILENIFGEAIPPPPPDVPELNFDTSKELKGTVRQIFEQHRVDPTCASCHARMDPYGFALENYDGYGAWRDKDNGSQVDPSGQINGKAFKTPIEFRKVLADRQDDFRRAMVRKVMSYALGRGLQTYDRSAVEDICAKVKADGDRFSSVILQVVKSYPFQHARGMKGDMPETKTVSKMYYPPKQEPPPPAPARPKRPAGSKIAIGPDGSPIFDANGVPVFVGPDGQPLPPNPPPPVTDGPRVQQQ